MGHLGELIEAYQLTDGASDRHIARKLGVSHSLIGKWRRGEYSTVPGEPLMRALADQIRVPYRTVVEAALDDTYFKNEGSDGDGDAAATTEAS